jgi:hypothetical protein
MIRTAPRLRLPAVRLAAPLAALARMRGTARVLAVFRRSAYLELTALAPVEPAGPPQDLPRARRPLAWTAAAHVEAAGPGVCTRDGDLPRLVALTSPQLDPGPFDAAVVGFEHVRAALRPAADVELDRGILVVDDVEVDLNAASRWDPELPRPWGDGAAPHAPAARHAVEQVLQAHAPAESLAGLLRRRAHPPDGRLAPFARALEMLAPPAEALAGARAAALVAGRGPGLTPSGDDLLCGVMLATWVWPGLAAAGRAAALRARIAEAASPRTTTVGAAYVQAAQRGWASGAWHRLVLSLGDAPAARAAALQVLAIGETSGADALAGFCWAWRVAPDLQGS